MRLSNLFTKDYRALLLLLSLIVAMVVFSVVVSVVARNGTEFKLKQRIRLLITQTEELQNSDYRWRPVFCSRDKHEPEIYRAHVEIYDSNSGGWNVYCGTFICERGECELDTFGLCVEGDLP
ncbi:hypothetical protein KAH43_06355 [Candidatus Bipolaricaulota bacterium]|nr:hypothetical protein [Candidatus Bipolaricaulota bacterium]